LQNAIDCFRTGTTGHGGPPPAIVLYVRAGADTNATPQADGQTPGMHRAVHFADAEIFKLDENRADAIFYLPLLRGHLAPKNAV